MTFLSLVLVVTQSVSIGVVDEPLVLANGTRLMPGDRVLAIHDSTHPWLTFLPSGEFLPLDSASVVIGDEWHAPDVRLADHPEVESGLWSEPDRKSGRVPWRTQDQGVRFFRPSALCHRDSSFWAKLPEWLVNGWFPLTRKEVMSSLSGFGPSSDSSRARVPFDLAEATRLGSDPWQPPRPDSVKYHLTARLYELSLAISTGQSYREMAADALLRLATLDIEHKADSVALARCLRAAREFVGVKSMFGRTDAYADWQMMELAWRHKDIATTCSLARAIISNYPTEAGEERVITAVGPGGTRVYGTQSIWFDVRAAERLLESLAGDESQEEAAAKSLIKSMNIAVRFRGYEKLIALSHKHSNTVCALSYARTALSLPRYWQWNVTPPSGCTYQGGRSKYDFRDEFITRLDGILPFDDLLRLYDGAFDAKVTMVSRDAANWLIRQIEQGRTPPRDGILDRIGPPTSPVELKRALLASITTVPQWKTAEDCTLFTRRPRYSELLPQVTRPLPRGSPVRASVLQNGQVRVVTSSGLSGWTNSRALSGTASLWDFPAIDAVAEAELLAVTDINGDGVRDVGLSTKDLLDGKDLTAVHPANQNSNSVTGLFLRKWVESRPGETRLRGVGSDTGVTVVPVAGTAKKGVCRPESCFYFVAMPGAGESLTWVSAANERGVMWTSALPSGKGNLVGLFLVDTIVVLAQANSVSFLSAVDGSLRGQLATQVFLRFGRGVFLSQSGFAQVRGDSVIFRDYSGSRTLGVAMGKSNAVFFPPFAPSLESGTWSERVFFGQPLWTITSKVIPVITQVSRSGDKGQHVLRAVHLISLRDGRELATDSVPENSDCRYDRHGLYVSGDRGFRAITWEGKPLPVPDLPFLSFPIWDGDRAVAYYSKPMGLMLRAETASRLADAVRHSRSRRRENQRN